MWSSCWAKVFYTMAKGVSPAKLARSYRRLINFLLKKSKSSKLAFKSLPSINILPETKILSKSKLTNLSFSPAKIQLTTSQQPSTDILPNSKQNILNQDLLSKVEVIQVELIETEKGFREMLSLKDEQIKILMEQIRNLPAQLIHQFQQLRPS